MALVKLEWYRRTVSDKLLKSEFIIQQMTLNAATFVTPNPTLADVDAARIDLSKAAVAAQAGGLALTLAKNEAEKHHSIISATSFRTGLPSHTFKALTPIRLMGINGTW